MLPLLDTTERRIARLLADDPQEGLGALLRAYGGRVRGYLAKRFRGVLAADERDEALNEALFRVWRRFDETRGHAGAWFLRMAHQAAVDLVRQKVARPAVALDGGEAEREVASGEPSLGLPEETVHRLYAAIEKLSPRERAVIEQDLAADGKARTDRLAEVFHAHASSISRSRRKAYAKLKQMMSE